MRLLIGGQGIADAGDGADEFVPADLFAQIAVVTEREIAQRAGRRERNHDSDGVSAKGGEPSEEDSGDTAPRESRQGAQPALPADRAHATTIG